MADGARDLYDADLAVSTTGTAGPGPDARGVPAGTVWLGLARRGARTTTHRLQLEGERAQVRAQVVDAALAELARRSEEHTSELQSRGHLVCRLLLEKQKIIVTISSRI